MTVSSAAPQPLQGAVKFFNAEKGYGFIKPGDGSQDVFVHAKELRKSGVQGDLEEGDVVQFETEKAEKGLRAVKIARVE